MPSFIMYLKIKINLYLGFTFDAANPSMAIIIFTSDHPQKRSCCRHSGSCYASYFNADVSALAGGWTRTPPRYISASGVLTERCQCSQVHVNLEWKSKFVYCHHNLRPLKNSMYRARQTTCARCTATVRRLIEVQDLLQYLEMSEVMFKTGTRFDGQRFKRSFKIGIQHLVFSFSRTWKN